MKCSTMPFVTRGELRWSGQISFSNAICKVIYRRLDHHLKIARGYAFKWDTERDGPGSMCHCPGLAQSNLRWR